MPLLTDRLVRTSLLIVETACLYVVLSALGSPIGNGNSILSWYGIVALLAVAILVQRWVLRLKLSEAWTRSIGLWTAVTVIYITIGFDESGLNWLVQLLTSKMAGIQTSRTMLGALAALFLWWRGLWIGSRLKPGETLGRVFPWGLACLIAAALLEVATGMDLNVAPMTFLFFAVSLGGLALANLDEGTPPAAWARTFIGITGVVLACGFVVSFLPGTFMGDVAQGLLGITKVIAEAVLIVFLFFAEYVLRVLLWVMGVLVDLFGSENLEPRTVNASGIVGAREAVQAGEGIPGILVAVIKWLFIAVTGATILGFLYWVLAVHLMKRNEDEFMTRESARDEDGSKDIGGLLAGLLPRWKTILPIYYYPLPAGVDPGVIVCRLYYQLLNVATRQGEARSVAETPLEYSARLQRVFPSLPIAALTEAFDQVRFGMQRIDGTKASELAKAINPVLGDKENALPKVKEKEDERRV